ncbi:OLC1v1019276C1 [Oldenlandia corymbosa var. corymbosa]|uniref:OLC1v1019276C1 n=1 Tax=Oldenlandia corymbosa var. corymbosa TaxID=529605 RepID=A0AAV1EDM4_OLDCO|nr:OLC1v1019276C1 [Oldenlandia corymbosa var. corymbosa]
MEDVRSLSIIGQRTFDADSFGYDRLGEIAQLPSGRCPPDPRTSTTCTSEAFAQSRRGRGGKRQSQHLSHISPPKDEQPHIPFTGGSSHRSPHRLHSILDSIQPIGLHIIHPIVSTSFFADPSAFYRPIMSPKDQAVNFSFTRFSSLDFSSFGDSFIDFSGFQQSSLDGHRYITRVTFFRVCSRVLRVASADNPPRLSVRVGVRMRPRMRPRMRMRMRPRMRHCDDRLRVGLSAP